VTLNGANDAPTGTDQTLSVATGNTALTLSQFGFNDVDTSDSIKAVRIDSLPSAGSLLLNGNAVTAGAIVSASDISAGRLLFNSASNTSSKLFPTRRARRS
jgi:hypothetical protein